MRDNVDKSMYEWLLCQKNGIEEHIEQCKRMDTGLERTKEYIRYKDRLDAINKQLKMIGNLFEEIGIDKNHKGDLKMKKGNYIYKIIMKNGIVYIVLSDIEDAGEFIKSITDCTWQDYILAEKTGGSNIVMIKSNEISSVEYSVEIKQ